MKQHEAERVEEEERKILQSDSLLDEGFTEDRIDEQRTTDKEKIKTSL